MTWQGIDICDLDILNPAAIVRLLKEKRPDYIFHLAAQSSVAVSWKNPGLTVDVNIKGSLNVLDAVRKLDYKPRVLLIGSGEEYGHVRQDEVPVQEGNVLRPEIFMRPLRPAKICWALFMHKRTVWMCLWSALSTMWGPNQSPDFRGGLISAGRQPRSSWG